MLSPSKACTGSPSNWNATGLEASIAWVGCEASLASGFATAIYAPASPGQWVCFTWLVTVSRTAMNHRRHPRAWYHHSR